MCKLYDDLPESVLLSASVSPDNIIISVNSAILYDMHVLEGCYLFS